VILMMQISENFFNKYLSKQKKLSFFHNLLKIKPFNFEKTKENSPIFALSMCGGDPHV